MNVAAIFSSFVPPPMSTLTVQKTGFGSGTVTSAPTGINCGVTCSAQFPQDNMVTLTATAAPGSTFVGWSGACSGLSCTVAMNTDQTVTAQFEPAPVTLTVNTSGPGEGLVTSDPGGISCPSACTASFTRGTTVTLTPTAIGNSIFVGWRGGPCEAFGFGPCTITLNDDVPANARFERFGG